MSINNYPTHATSSTLELIINNSSISVNFTATNANGTFKTSNINTVSARTNNATGYTLSIAANSNDSHPELLTNSSDNNATLSSISDNVTETNFSSLVADSSITNKWGYYFIPHGSVASGNHVFSPAPTTNGDIIATTSSGNSEYDQYDLAIGARVDQTIKTGSYTNTYVIQLVGNPVPYTILYHDPSIANMPIDISSTSASSSVNISSNTPKKNGYTFIGWCDTTPTTSAFTDTCPGNTYDPEDEFVVSQVSGAHDLSLYAMWQRNTMQNVSEWKGTLNINDETTAIDTRDGKIYSVARLCMNTSGCTTGAEDPNDTNSKLWMTQNLDLIVGQSGVAVLTSNDSDLNSGSGTIYTTGYSTSNGVITWTPDSSRLSGLAYSAAHNSSGNTDTVSGWTHEDSYPHQGEGGDFYVFNSSTTASDTIYKSLDECVTAGHTAELCRHYHVGNYYSWTAAVASNNSSAFSDSASGMPYVTANNSICPKGWRLPKGLSGSDKTNDNNITEFNRLALAYDATTGRTTTLSSSASDALWEKVDWTTDGFNIWRSAPLYFFGSGGISVTSLAGFSTVGFFWSSTVRSGAFGYHMQFSSNGLSPATQGNRGHGLTLRCIAR